MKTTLLLSFIFFSSIAYSVTTQRIWAQIPFNIQGANLCEFKSAYSQNRTEYIEEMIKHARELMFTHSHGNVSALSGLNYMYRENLKFARYALGSFLERSFKAYLEKLYKELKPKHRRLIFYNQNSHIDLFAHGDYSLSPRCNGEIIVHLQLIKSDTSTKEYMAQGPSQVVMSKIAAQVFEDYQRTVFPSTIQIRGKGLTLIGDHNAFIGSTQYIDQGQNLCTFFNTKARLPTASEYKIINACGSWSGGVSLGRKIWVIGKESVFIPYFPASPVRTPMEVNDKTFHYICVI